MIKTAFVVEDCDITMKTTKFLLSKLGVVNIITATNYKEFERLLSMDLQPDLVVTDWNIDHSSPAGWPYGSLPYSTFQEKRPGGFRDKTGLMPDKAAIMALAYLDLHEAEHGLLVLDGSLALAEHVASGDDERTAHEKLSDREFQVLKLIAGGKKLSEIADALALSPKTVSVYRARLLEKMGMKTNADLTYYAIKNGLVE